MPADDGSAPSVYTLNVNDVLALIINLERGFYFIVSASAASSAITFPVHPTPHRTSARAK